MKPEASSTDPAHLNSNQHGRRGLQLLAGLLLLLLGGLLAARLLPLGEWNEALADWGQTVGWTGALLAGLLFVPVCVLMLPATALTYAIAFAFGWGPAVLGVEVGALLGAVAVFLLGRTLARNWVREQSTRRPMLGALNNVITERSFGLLVLIRMSPLFPYALVGYALGATRAHFGRHLVATGLAIFPQVTLTCWIGSRVAEFSREVGTDRAKEPLEYVLMGLGAVAALVALAVISRRTRAALQTQLRDPNA